MKNFLKMIILNDLNNTCMYHHDQSISVKSFVVTNILLKTLDKHDMLQQSLK